jgi:glycosyltransferase involved in cell wall biosynthesis
MTGLSIVVTTFNRSAVLASLLGKLAGQTDMDFEVVVAIDGSTDDTEGMLPTLELPYALKWVNTHCKGYGLAVARNLGILASSRDAVAILDDDSVPHRGYVAAHKRSVKRNVITGGPRIPADDNERMSWKMRELARLPPLVPIALGDMRREWPNAYLIENNICMFREDFIAAGLFSERVKMYGFIGQEFFGRAEFLGLSYQYNPEAAITHHGEIAGDNGFDMGRKARQTMLATLVRPSLMVSRHYRAQVSWARALSEGRRMAMPPFGLHAAAALPWRLATMLATRANRRVRGALR